MTLFIIPQLPVKNRYQEHWMSWWSEELHNLGVDYYVIRPNNWLEYEEKTKYFMPNKYEYFAPVELSIRWDAEIAVKLTNMLQFMGRGDYLLFLDFDYTGLFQGLIPLIRRYNPDLEMGAYVHAGSWAPGDYFELVRDSKIHIELGTSRALNNLFFPTKTAMEDAINGMCKVAEDIIMCVSMLKSKSHVVGALWKPYDEITGALVKKQELIREEKWLKESNVVMINGRYDSLDHKLLSQTIEKLRGKVTFVATDKRVAERYYITHMNYYDALGVAKVMLQPKIYDTFGLAVVEALYTLTVPVLPMQKVYQELYLPFTKRDLVNGVLDAIDNYNNYIRKMREYYSSVRDKHLNAPKRIIEILEFI